MRFTLGGGDGPPLRRGAGRAPLFRVFSGYASPLPVGSLERILQSVSGEFACWWAVSAGRIEGGRQRVGELRVDRLVKRFADG